MTPFTVCRSAYWSGAIAPAVAMTLAAIPPAAADLPTVGTVQQLVAGDAACRVTLIDEGGQPFSALATFDICRQNLVGQRVQLTYETANVLAAACQGDPDCGQTETVMVVTQAEVIAPPSQGRVAALVFGDRACSVDIVDEAGQRSTQLATFEICVQDLVGTTAQFTYEPSPVVAAVCGGDLDCGQSDTVLLITQATVMAPPQGIADLPDGNYRYWSGTSTQAVVSASELLAEGGVLFLFRKQGDRIAGIFSYVDGEAICVEGQVAGNTVAGIAVQTPGDTVLSQTESFAPFGPGAYLTVRRGQPWQDDAVLYNSALLNLNGLNRINAGPGLPPAGCL